MSAFCLCLAWNWEHDAGFAHLLDEACQRRGISLLQVTPKELPAVLDELASGRLFFEALLDRASDGDDSFQPLVEWARRQGALRLNPQEFARWSWDKATMHLEFISRGLHTPYSIILPPQAEQPEVNDLDLSVLGGRFTIKPARGGGGWGVVLEATTRQQVEQARLEYPQEKVLLQSHIDLQTLEGHQAWFRVLYCHGAVFPCWWDTHTHIYQPLTADQAFRHGLGDLRPITRRIAQVCRLHLFSTEITRDAAGSLIVTDYVNDPLDLRLQSATPDGVPDSIVARIADRLAGLVQMGKPPCLPH